jgi:hypothetical protein
LTETCLMLGAEGASVVGTFSILSMIGNFRCWSKRPRVPDSVAWQGL